ncbi:hypothetical protein TcCL_ESM10598 [Trypanosoma cruzi]|nr:hypothetical protein TcCL_ESM10598 [Trypanosoma cruzi]
MDFGLANDPAQATRIKNCDVSSPDVTAYCVLRISHRTSTPHMDSDHSLISYSVGMDDGIPRLANTLPRREKATFAQRKADWPASTSLCETLPSTASTWFDVLRGNLREAERHIPRGSRENPNTMWTHETEQAEIAAEAAYNAHIASPGDSLVRAELIQKEGNKIRPYAVASLCLWKPVWKNMRLHPAQTGDISAAWRRRTLILWDRWCSALIFGPRLRPAPETGKSASPSFFAGFTCHITLYCCCCPPHSFELW